MQSKEPSETNIFVNLTALLFPVWLQAGTPYFFILIKNLS